MFCPLLLNFSGVGVTDAASSPVSLKTPTSAREHSRAAASRKT